MKKKKLNNSKTEAVPTTDTLAVPEADTSPIASESPDPVTIPETQKEEPVAILPEPQPVLQMSRIQHLWIATMLIFADCSVQKSPEGIFDVLARNFEDTGALSWWMWRIGYGDKTKLLKGKDIVDVIRKVAHLLYRDLKKGIGRPVARF